ncbi:MAG: DNA-binding response regulator, OmpR family, contains R [Pelagibacterales bacterium]|nr:DNA-binding response regulator, OmpR family, contains R [Pelagibacterales bacterium]
MTDLTISIFNNSTFFEILNEMKLFSKFKIKHYKDLNLCTKTTEKENNIVIFFSYPHDYIQNINFPSILISDSLEFKNKFSGELKYFFKKPLSIIDFNQKLISLFAKREFKVNSLIGLNGYIIDKNERKIKKNNIELQLSEKEVDFLILFTNSNTPINKEIFLKKVWNYSVDSETHTIETHIHKLRKKILDKFGDNDFIKNNKKGYFV